MYYTELFHEKMLWLKLWYVGKVLMSQLYPQMIQLKEEMSGDEIPFLVQKEACLDACVATFWTKVIPDHQQEGQVSENKVNICSTPKEVHLTKFDLGTYCSMETFLFMYLSHMAEKLNTLSGNAFFFILRKIQLLRCVYHTLSKNDIAIQGSQGFPFSNVLKIPYPVVLLLCGIFKT